MQTCGMVHGLPTAHRRGNGHAAKATAHPICSRAETSSAASAFPNLSSGQRANEVSLDDFGRCANDQEPTACQWSCRRPLFAPDRKHATMWRSDRPSRASCRHKPTVEPIPNARGWVALCTRRSAPRASVGRRCAGARQFLDVMRGSASSLRIADGLLLAQPTAYRPGKRAERAYHSSETTQSSLKLQYQKRRY